MLKWINKYVNFNNFLNEEGMPMKKDDVVKLQCKTALLYAENATKNINLTNIKADVVKYIPMLKAK